MSTAVAKIEQLNRMSPDELKKQPAEALAVYADSLRSNKIAALGDGQVFVRRDEKGVARGFVGQVSLSVKNNEIYNVQGKTKISADGYTKLNQIAGVSIVTPPTLSLPDGQRVVNPYILRETDPMTKRSRTVGVWVRKTAVGYAPTGSLMVIDGSLYLDLEIYFLQDVMKKISKAKEAGRLCLFGQITDEEKKTCLILPYQFGIYVVAKLSHQEILSALDTHIQRQKFAERVAVTICERNVLRKHPAIAASQVDALAKGESWDKMPDKVQVKVFGWAHDMTPKDIEKAAHAADSDEPTPGVQVQRSTVKTTETEEGQTIDMEDMEGAYEDAATEEAGGKEPSKPADEGGEDEPPKPFEFDPTQTPKMQKEALIEVYGLNPFIAAWDETVGTEWTKASPEQKREALIKIADQLKKMQEATE